MRATTPEPVIHSDGCVLAAIDASPLYAHSVGSYAAWAALRLDAPLQLLHTIERSVAPPAGDLSGNLALGSREDLLQQLAALDEQRGRLAQEHGRLLLERVQAQLASEHGVEAACRQRHGALVDTLLELEPDVRLFVLGKRGEHADFASGHLGSNLERVLRSVHRPVLVAARAFHPVQRFLIAFDGSPTTRKCVDMVCASPLLSGVECHLLLVGADDAANQAHIAWGRERLGSCGFAAHVHRIDGTADTVIAQQVAALAIDLLVMGAYGHSRIRSMILGSTTTQVLRACPIPVLLLR